MASGVGTLTWIAFLPFGLTPGLVSQRSGVHRAGWMITAVVVVAGAVLVKLALSQRVPGATDGLPTHCLAAAAS
ncbi:MAG: hypothetical protein ACRD29_07380 [Acidimicrobiales bacterium]